MPQGKEKLRVGVIGVGGISRSRHLPYWHECPRTELIALADINAVSLADTARKYRIEKTFRDWTELVRLDDLDIVDVATPNRFHAPMALAALRAGKHVLCEKPFAVTAAEAEQLVAASRLAGKVLMANHVFRFSRSLLSLRQLVGEGGLGRVYHVHARWLRRRSVPCADTFIRRELAGGGPILDLGVHMLDLACWFMNDFQPVRVSASVGRHLADRDDISGRWGDWDRKRFDVEDFGIALIHFGGGTTLLLEVSWLGFLREPEVRSLRVLGTHAGLHWPEGIICSERAMTPYDTSLVDTDDGDVFRASIHAFVDAVENQLTSPIPPEQSLAVARMIEAIYESAATGREIVLQNDDAG